MANCEVCDGTGEVHISCCGDDVKDTEAEDIGLCPTCREHLGDRETCYLCGGTGLADPIEQEHNRQCNYADDYNKKKKEDIT